MEERSQSDNPIRDDSVYFRSEEDTSYLGPLGMSGLGLATTLILLRSLLSGGQDRWLDVVIESTSLLFGLFLTAMGLYSLIKGSRLRGLRVDGEGIVDRTKRFPAGRIYWEEIKSVYPFNPSFLGIPTSRRFIGLEVTDSYFEKQSWWDLQHLLYGRNLSSARHIQINTKALSGSRERILREIESRLVQHQLRSIAEAKELESGS